MISHKIDLIAATLPEKSPVSLGNNRTFGSFTSKSRLTRYFLQGLVAQLMPYTNVTTCLKLIIPGRVGVPVLYSDEKQRARLGNLCTCGLIWICPVCASRISEGRSALLSAAMSAVQVNPVLITFTMSHGASQRLAPNLAALTDAYKALTHGSVWIGFEQRYGWITAIRALEVTHGDNGWHPHMHVLAFLKQPLHYDEQPFFDLQLSELWLKRLASKGASASAKHGVDVRTAKKDAIDYVAKFGRDSRGKWGLERELTKAVTKNARWKGRTPWALLSDYGKGDQQSGALFVEYADAFKGRKQLVTPNAARELLNMKQVTDGQLAAAPLSEIERVLIRLDVQQWKRVLLSDLRADLILVANTGSADQLAAWLMRVGVL